METVIIITALATKVIIGKMIYRSTLKIKNN